MELSAKWIEIKDVAGRIWEETDEPCEREMAEAVIRLVNALTMRENRI